MTNDVLIIGGGIIGLACGLELKLRGANVTVLSRDFTAAASHAAAGMLAPEAENITHEPMLSLCRRSRNLYLNWTEKLAELTGEKDVNNTGYWPCGILAPVYQQPQNTGDRNAHWLNKDTINQYQPGLGQDVVGGWWYPEDGQVDNRALIKVLRTAAESEGIIFQDGVTVEAISQQQGKVIGVQTNIGLFRADHYLLTAGAWVNQLLPLAVRPRKGQMLSLRVPDCLNELPLTRVLFGEGIYIVPRRNRSIIIGATNEDVGFTAYNTPVGIQSLLQSAIRLYPQLENYPLQELWWGFRPATSDELPILGASHCPNLTLATGHYRNGILLAPVTAILIADLICEQKTDPLLPNFHYSRFSAVSSTTTSMPINSTVTNTNINSVKKLQNKSVCDIATPPRLSDLNIQDSPLIIAGKSFSSRLMTGTGKYRSIQEMQQSVENSGCQIVTVAVRRVQTNAPGHEGLGEA
ncbi:MAG: glycine oxidase ThiO, partial [Dolichospermum sp.]